MSLEKSLRNIYETTKAVPTMTLSMKNISNYDLLVLKFDLNGGTCIEILGH